MSIVLAMRRIGARITAAPDEATALDALVAGVTELARPVPVALHRGDDASPVDGMVLPIVVMGSRRTSSLVIGGQGQEVSEVLVAAAGQLAALAAASIGQLHLQRSVVQRSMQLAQLNDLSHQLNSAESSAAALHAASVGAAAMLGAPDLGLYQVREGLLVLTGNTGDASDFPVTLRALDSRGGVLFGGERGHPMPLGTSRLSGRAALLRVLRVGDRVEGLLVLRAGDDRAGWGETELMLAEGITEHLAVALRHIELLEKSRHQAAYDDLTGLASRRQFMHEIARETARVKRQGSPLTLLMVDADHFKVVNDTHGHAAGDEVLRALAACLQRGTRSLDVVGRLGGEEIGVLLPGADEASASVVAGRLRASVEAMEVPWKDAVIRITVSIGLAEWDGEMTYEDLLEAADEALYRSKAAGRNRVTVGGSLETVQG